jgi:hypothetical protein
MPASAAPHVVILGLSPGAARPSDKAAGTLTYRQGWEPPSIGEPSSGFYDKDPKQYWPKAKDLCIYLVKRDAPKLAPTDALSLASHLNLGTGQFGKGGPEAVEEDIVKWVSSSLYSIFRAKILVCFGLNGIFANERFCKLWNCKGGLPVKWNNPDDDCCFASTAFKKSYHFRLWKTQRADGKPMAVLMWPNHPSQHPFAGGPEESNWREARRQADRFLKKHSF